MWVLEGIDRQEWKFCLFPTAPDEPIEVGRNPTCRLLLKDDKCASRSHALLLVEGPIQLNNPQDGGSVTLETRKTKHGTLVNNERVLDESRRQLKDGDVIRFGMTLFKLTYQPVAVCCSSVPKDIVYQVSEAVRRIGGHFMQQWTTECTHLVMTKLQITEKVVLALAHGRPVVTPDWIITLQAEGSLLPEDQFQPPVVDQFVGNDVSFGTNPMRKRLFTGMKFVFLAKQKFTEIITSCGGTILTYDPKRLSELAADPSVCIFDEKSFPDKPRVLDAVQKAGRRLVGSSEVAQAVLHASTDRYCNPSAPPPITAPNQSQHMGMASQMPDASQSQIGESQDLLHPSNRPSRAQQTSSLPSQQRDRNTLFAAPHPIRRPGRFGRNGEGATPTLEGGTVNASATASFAPSLAPSLGGEKEAREGTQKRPLVHEDEESSMKKKQKNAIEESHQTTKATTTPAPPPSNAQTPTRVEESVPQTPQTKSGNNNNGNPGTPTGTPGRTTRSARKTKPPPVQFVQEIPSQPAEKEGEKARENEKEKRAAASPPASRAKKQKLEKAPIDDENVLESLLESQPAEQPAAKRPKTPTPTPAPTTKAPPPAPKTKTPTKATPAPAPKTPRVARLPDEESILDELLADSPSPPPRTTTARTTNSYVPESEQSEPKSGSFGYRRSQSQYSAGGGRADGGDGSVLEELLGGDDDEPVPVEKSQPKNQARGNTWFSLQDTVQRPISMEKEYVPEMDPRPQKKGRQQPQPEGHDRDAAAEHEEGVQMVIETVPLVVHRPAEARQRRQAAPRRQANGLVNQKVFRKVQHRVAATDNRVISDHDLRVYNSMDDKEEEGMWDHVEASGKPAKKKGR